MFRYQPPSAPACTQWPAVHTVLDLPGCAGSSTTVAEQTIVPSGESKNTLPASGALAWYVGDTAFASTGSGVGSVTPWSPERSLSSTALSGSSAPRIRSGFHRPLMIGLMYSSASRSQSSLSHFFQAPFFHLSMSIPCSLSLSLTLSGIVILPSPSDAAEAVAPPPASASPDSQAVAVSASADASATAASKGEVLRRAFLLRRAVNDGLVDRMSASP